MDPVETRRTPVADGVEYTGCWAMTEDKLADVHRLKGVHGDWPWSKCFEEAGGGWILGCESLSLEYLSDVRSY